MPTTSEWFIIALMAIAVVVIPAHLVFGLLKGKVFAPNTLLERALKVPDRGYFATRAEHPYMYWSTILIHAALTAGILFVIGLYIVHPEVFIWSR